tara:strand:+ start:8877 stop:9062 length:186 start_codon:yes stop_codon:yes gene_type:complete
MDVLWIILLALGIIISNLMVLRYSSKFKFPTRNKPDSEKAKSSLQDESKASKTQVKETSDT